ncbi:MAG: response regulator [Haloarculaceae archaeon]
MGRGRVLVVEDDEVLRATIEIWLEDADWGVEAVSNGNAAVEALDDALDVVVCDRRVPGPNATDVVARLDERSFDVPVVVVSGYEPDDDLGEDDVAAYLGKPVKREVLTAVLGRLV